MGIGVMAAIAGALIGFYQMSSTSLLTLLYLSIGKKNLRDRDEARMKIN